MITVQKHLFKLSLKSTSKPQKVSKIWKRKKPSQNYAFLSLFSLFLDIFISNWWQKFKTRFNFKWLGNHSNVNRNINSNKWKYQEKKKSYVSFSTIPSFPLFYSWKVNLRKPTNKTETLEEIRAWDDEITDFQSDVSVARNIKNLLSSESVNIKHQCWANCQVLKEGIHRYCRHLYRG